MPAWSTTAFLTPPTPTRQCITTWHADDARYLDQMNHGILEEHQVHPRSTDALVVLLHKHEQACPQLLKGLNLWDACVFTVRLQY